MCKFSIYIGDNASGKTRYAIEDALEGKLDKDRMYRNVITNLPYIKTENMYSKERQNLIDKSDFMSILNSDIELHGIDVDKTKAKELINKLNSNGNVLLLDDLDSILSTRYMVLLLNFIKRNKHLWDKVIINGYSGYLLNVMSEEGANIKYVQGLNNIRILTDDEAMDLINELQ